jgi:PDDEXK-like uncharacterized protein DUF3799
MSVTLQVRIDQPGIYAMSDDAYLADPVVDPSLNASTAKVLVGLSPLHAWAMHPRLGMAADDDSPASEAQDVGHAAHQMFLHGASKIRVLSVPDFRTNKAKEMRDAAIAAGQIPLKAERFAAVNAIVNKLEEFRLRTGAFTKGKPEQALIWREGTQWGRCKVDWLPDEPEAYLWDLKTTSGRATPQSWARNAFDLGYDLQAVYYCRGAECVRGEPPEGMRFCVIETKPPYGIKVFEFSPAAIGDAQQEVHSAIELWTRCRETGEWPSYSDDLEWIDPPPWKIREREFRRHNRQNSLRTGADQAAVDMMLKTGNLGG